MTKFTSYQLLYIEIFTRACFQVIKHSAQFGLVVYLPHTNLRH